MLNLTFAKIHIIYYVIGGIPAMIYGICQYNYDKHFRIAGGLLALSGATGLFIAIGVIMGNRMLVSTASMIGGALAIAADLPMSVNLIRGESHTTQLKVG